MFYDLKIRNIIREMNDIKNRLWYFDHKGLELRKRLEFLDQ